jgi:transmembrane sensor
MDINNENIDDLLARYLAEETDPDETIEVEQWEELSDENRKVVRQSRALWDGASGIKSEQNVDTNAAWLKLKNQMDLNENPAHLQEESKSLFSKKSNFNQVYKIAASVLLAFGFGYFIYQFTQKPTTEFETFSTTKLPSEKTLPDGTKIFLNKNSSISFSKNYFSENREISLTGEAFFDVFHDAKHPFVIHTQGTDVRVLGTSFNIRAYNQNVKVSVKTGKVQFSKKSKKIFLLKDDEAILIADTDSIMKSVMKDKNFMAYMTQTFNFENTPLSQVIETLSANFDKKIVLKNTATANCKLTATFEKEKLDKILDLMSESLSLKIEKKSDNSIVIEGKGCGE